MFVDSELLIAEGCTSDFQVLINEYRKFANDDSLCAFDIVKSLARQGVKINAWQSIDFDNAMLKSHFLQRLDEMEADRIKKEAKAAKPKKNTVKRKVIAES